MNKQQKNKIINDLKLIMPNAKQIELEITKDELSKYLFKKSNKNLGAHPILRMKARIGIKKNDNKEILTLMYSLICNELERRNKYVSKVNQSKK